ncbi:DUF3995 domain-containing protein [Paenibacillus wynnii]|uniref:DUF3995 domain-containing protein n=1 Tax=Paenibacillus wynnii TaxID=268407 RepID=A0A098MFQ2_9BACL|nr:DUF3995 domain-containing protein [Paenibacillus wynnii]KGE20881.1 hypothetical protein PWYN_01495 [Paenibacillus wynnii]
MIMSIVSIAVVLLFLLGALHIYWACGGKFGSTAAVPVREDESGGSPVFVPGKIATLIIAFLLGGVAYALSVQSGLIVDLLGFETRIYLYLCAISGGVFTLRCIGDFRYVGWFKTVRGTRFATMDQLLYTPICLFLAIIFTFTCFGIS